MGSLTAQAGGWNIKPSQWVGATASVAASIPHPLEGKLQAAAGEKSYLVASVRVNNYSIWINPDARQGVVVKKADSTPAEPYLSLTEGFKW